MKRQVLAAVAVAGLLIGIGCSGGSGSGVAPAPVQSPGGGNTTAKMNFVMTIPGPATTAGSDKAPAYVSAGTQSVSISANGGSTETFNVAPLPNATCVASGPNYVCTIQYDAPLDSTTLTVDTYDGLNGTGDLLSSGSVVVSITPGATNTINVTLDGTASSIALSVTPNTVLNGGTASDYTAKLVAMDASNNTIVGAVLNGSGATISPTLTSSDQTHLAVGSLNTSTAGKRAARTVVNGYKWDVEYDGTDLSAGPPTLTLAVSGYTIAGVTFTANPAPTPVPTATPTPAPTPTPTIAPNPTPAPSGFIEFTSAGAKSITLTEAGYNGNYTVTSDNGTVLSVDASPITSTSGSATLAVHANASGTANLTVTDDNGQILVVPVRVTITGVTIN